MALLDSAVEQRLGAVTRARSLSQAMGRSGRAIRGRGRGRGRENVGERKTSEEKKRETKNERPNWWQGEKNKWEV